MQAPQWGGKRNIKKYTISENSSYQNNNNLTGDIKSPSCCTQLTGVKNMNKYPIHPMADVFPMLQEDELTALSESIKQNGLRHSIVTAVVDGEIMVIDGRNRLSACELAGIEPAYIEYEGNVADYIYDENITRRHLTISQAAIGEALLFPKGRKNNQHSKVASPDTMRSGASRDTMRYARKLVDPENNATDLVEQVKKGPLTVGAAYKELTNRQGGYNAIETRLKELKENAPDLAELVNSGQAINEVYASYTERKTADRLSKITILNDLRSVHAFLGKIKSPERARHILDAIYSEHLTGATPEEEVIKLKDLISSINILYEEAKL